MSQENAQDGVSAEKSGDEITQDSSVTAEDTDTVPSSHGNTADDVKQEPCYDRQEENDTCDIENNDHIEKVEKVEKVEKAETVKKEGNKHEHRKDVSETVDQFPCSSIPSHFQKSSTLPTNLSPNFPQSNSEFSKHAAVNQIPHQHRLANSLRSSRSHDQKLTNLSTAYKPFNKRLSSLIGSSKSHDRKSASDRDIVFSIDKTAHSPHFNESLIVPSFKERFKHRHKLELLNRSGSHELSEASESSFEDFKSITNSNSGLGNFCQSFDSGPYYSCSEFAPVESDCESYGGFVSASNSLTPIAVQAPTGRLYQHRLISAQNNNSDGNIGRFSLRSGDRDRFYFHDSESQFDSFHTALGENLSRNCTLRTDSNFDSFVTIPECSTSSGSSKLTKAKDALIKGCGFVKAKFNLYKTRIPSILRRDQRGDNSDRAASHGCNNTCGFSCIHLGKEISQYSFGAPEPHEPLKGSQSEGNIKGDHSTNTLEESSSSYPSLPPKICFEQYLIEDKYRLKTEAEVSCSGQEVVVMSNTPDNTQPPSSEINDTVTPLGKDRGSSPTQEKTLAGVTDTETQDSIRDSDGRTTTAVQNSDTAMTVIDQSGSGKGGAKFAADCDQASDRQTMPTQLQNLGYHDDSVVGMETDLLTPQGSQDRSEEDELPIGTEAHTMRQGCSQQEMSSSSLLAGPSIKRVQWLSAREDTVSSSLHSSVTSNSRKTDQDSEKGTILVPNGVDQILQEREMDPETILSSLGFGCGSMSDQSLGRIPDRFLCHGSKLSGIDLYQMVAEHPDLFHLLPTWVKPVPPPQRSVPNSATSVTGASGGKDKWSKAQSVSSVIHSIKTLKSSHSEMSQNTADHEADLMNIKSVLDFKNRKTLAEQGFYGRQYMKKRSTEKNESQNQKELNAAQRRKQFHKASKSKNWSLTEAPADNVSPEKPREDVDSFDSGFLLRSFSTTRSTDSSSVETDDETRRNSICNLRRQFEQSVQQSIDEYDCLPLDVNPGEGQGGSTIAELRRKQVTRLMSSHDDDGDYFAQSRQSSFKEVDLMRYSQCSTLAGSPNTPKMFDFENEDERKIPEHFKYCSTTLNTQGLNRPPYKSMEDCRSSISILVEDHVGEVSEMSNPGSRSHSQDDSRLNPNDLLFPHSLTTVRSESCNTLVDPDNALDQEGELTPRPGEVSPTTECRCLLGDTMSESTGSSGTINTIVNNMDEVDHDDVQRSRSPMTGCQVTGMWPEVDKTRLHVEKEALPPQESFELEEVSSAENAADELHDGYKPNYNRGRMEKSNSTHSDSSGFADYDLSVEGMQSPPSDNHQTLIIYKKSRELEVKQNVYNRFATFPRQRSHRNRNAPSNSISTAMSLQQQNHIERQLPPDETALVAKQPSSANSSKPHDKIAVYKRRNSDSSNDIHSPVITSISYGKLGESDKNKSVRYTLEVPLERNILGKKPKLKDFQQKEGKLTKEGQKYVSMVDIDVVPHTADGFEGSDIQNTSFRVKGQTQYRNLCQSEPNLMLATQPMKLSSSSSAEKPKTVLDSNLVPSRDTVNYSKTGNQTQSSTNTDTGNVTSSAPGSPYDNRIKTKEQILRKKKSKEALVAAKSQTADWLLRNQRQERPDSPENVLHQPPVKAKSHNPDQSWRSSTPILSKPDDARLGLSHPSASLFLRDQPLGTPQRRSNFRHESSYSLTESESECIPSSSLHSSCGSLTGETHDYLKLARLVNSPSSVIVPAGNSPYKMSVIRYRPVVHMRRWHELSKRQHLEEEVRLMQHAVQKYKVELTMMETMLFNLYQLAGKHLTDEERADVEELQCLWAAVRKEVTETEQLLSTRLTCVTAGNDNFNPLNTLDIVGNMIDLLREQLYQQQTQLSREINDPYDDGGQDFLYLVSPAVSTSAISASSWSDMSHQIGDVRESLVQSQLQSKRDMEKSFSEMKISLMDEVKQELVGNSQWLHLQLQEKDNEIQRLKMENFMQNITTGKTRQRQIFESDV